MRRRTGQLSRRAQPRAARGRRDARRPAAGAGRRRHRQDARAHHAHRPHFGLGRARPCEILAVTFTNKAAREMQARVGQLIGGVVEGMPWLGTFHAIGVKILRRHAELVGSEAVLHHPRHRRPDPAAEAAARGREHRREALAGAAARRHDRRLEEPRAHAQARAGGRELRLRQRQGRASSTRSISSG